MSDAELLECYVKERSNAAFAAFAALVERHLDLVYSVARRHVQSSDLARDVAQAVFVELAQHAARIKPGTPLVAWLHVVSRRVALNTVRGEIRRQTRERQAAEIAEMKTNPPAPDWTTVEPLLDEAVESLAAPDRTAILLRYFENKSLRDVGESLGVSDDTAQKRVSRALEQLRAFFLKRGVAVGSITALATDLSAHAVQSAPGGLCATISTTAVLSGSTGTLAALETTRAIAMTTFQKSLAATLLALAVGTAIYEVAAFARQASPIAVQEQEAAALAAQLNRAGVQQAAATARLKFVEAQIDSRLPGSVSDAALESKLRNWQANLAQLKRTLVERPNLAIPELQLLSDDDWFEAATKAKLDSDDGVRRTLAGLREQATWLMGGKMRAALNAYLKANDLTLPDHLAQLLPLFDPPIDPAWLERYEILRTGKLSALSNRDRARIIGPKSFGDVEYDPSFTFGPNGGSSGPVAMDHNVHLARLAFGNAHRRQAKTAAELVPYLKWPATEAAVQKIIDGQNARAAAANERPAGTQPSRR